MWFYFDLPFWYGPIVLMYPFSHRLCLFQDRALVRLRPIPSQTIEVPPSMPGATFWKKTQGSVRFLTSKRHLDETQCAHSNAKCKPGSPNTMAQRVEPFKDHLRAALTTENIRVLNERQPHPSHKRGSLDIDAVSHFTGENTGFRSISNFPISITPLVLSPPYTHSSQLCILAHLCSLHISALFPHPYLSTSDH